MHGILGRGCWRYVAAVRVYVERVYVTMDSWESWAAYEGFRERFAKEYGELDRECEGLAVIEKQLGEYESYVIDNGS
jgi:hypothetical protein